MPGAGNPVQDDLLEFVARIAPVGGDKDVEDGFQAAGKKACQVIVQHSLERLLLSPLGMLGGQSLRPVQCKDQLEVERFLRPERAVVVKDRDSVQGWHELRSAV